MKWFSVILIGALALLSNACEKHPASQLPEEGVTAFGEHAAGHEAGEKHDTAPAAEPAAAKPESPAPAGETKPGEAPKFFPEKK
jgi:hypothetical protein